MIPRNARSNMIEQQVRPWDVLDQHVLDVLGEVAREDFLAPQHRGLAYSDYELPIGHGQHMLKPVLDGRLLQALALSSTDSVLEIGTGSGYLTACLARLAGRCESLEIVPELSAAAAERLRSIGAANTLLRVQDASDSWDARDGYDAIVLSGSVSNVPTWYREKLVVGGRMALVVGELTRPTMDARLVTRIGKNEWSTESLFETSITPLVNFSAAPSPFVF